MSKKKGGAPFRGVPLQELEPIMVECFAQGQEVVLTITGNSMSPFVLDRRDQVVLVTCDPMGLRPGDVPLYRRKTGQYVLHRIVKRDDGTVCTRWGREGTTPSQGGDLRYTMLGDAQWMEEPNIYPDQIVARATAFIRRGKRWECDSDKYVRNRLRWHRLLSLRPVLVPLYHLPRRLRYGVPRRLRRWLGLAEKK